MILQNPCLAGRQALIVVMYIYPNLVFAQRNRHSGPILGRSSPVHSKT
jgi:hypothetical protein